MTSFLSRRDGGGYVVGFGVRHELYRAVFGNNPVPGGVICSRYPRRFLDLLRRPGSRWSDVRVSRIVLPGDEKLTERYVGDRVWPFELVAQDVVSDADDPEPGPILRQTVVGRVDDFGVHRVLQASEPRDDGFRKSAFIDALELVRIFQEKSFRPCPFNRKDSLHVEPGAWVVPAFPLSCHREALAGWTRNVRVEDPLAREGSIFHVCVGVEGLVVGDGEAPGNIQDITCPDVS